MRSSPPIYGYFQGCQLLRVTSKDACGHAWTPYFPYQGSARRRPMAERAVQYVGRIGTLANRSMISMQVGGHHVRLIGAGS